MDTYNASPIHSNMNSIKTPDTTSIANTDTVVCMIINSLDEVYGLKHARLITVHNEDVCSVSVVGFDLEETPDLETLASELIASSQGHFKRWEYVNNPVVVSRIYNKYGEWDKLYLLKEDDDFYLVFNGEFLALKEDV